MASVFSTIFYIESDIYTNTDFLNITDIEFFRGIIEPILNKSIQRFINNPQDIINHNKEGLNNGFLFELLVQRKRNEHKIRKSISIDIVDNQLYSIIFNYNKFLSFYEDKEFINIINTKVDINKLNTLELRAIEYNKWIHEIIKYLKLSIYEDNMNYLMDNDLKKLPSTHKTLALIAKNLKTKTIEK